MRERLDTTRMAERIRWLYMEKKMVIVWRALSRKRVIEGSWLAALDLEGRLHWSVNARPLELFSTDQVRQVWWHRFVLGHPRAN